ncbi:hypothetical protein [Paracoccus marinaquae]|uniref:Uncharacterized protein n=1 Tax=Paracoccus marinaquae TaxID=2841926 RepID=A0ABS6AN13_9RHOB|nr:hypothetical protein [Paracoccus marinaquae]MBU3030831.1 hypothetical protein [Paracoccus marinaquae]
MIDFLLLGGVALCVLSLIYAVVQLLQAQPPRAAMITLILGIVAIFAAAYLQPEPFKLQDIGAAWDRVASGAPAPAP